MTGDALLTLNAGSSSLKFRLFGLAPGLPFLLGGEVSGIGGAALFETHRADGACTQSRKLAAGTGFDAALEEVLVWLDGQDGRWRMAAAAHRIVHGGPNHDRGIELDAPAMAYLRSLIPLAPLHQPQSLAGIETLWRRYPGLRQYGCFDTAFHARHEPLVTAFALPARVRDMGVRRYGFHGLSYAWIAHCLASDFPHVAEARVVAAHLGNGASLCAMKAGVSVDTTMGMTALDGLPMGTRCGALDPGVIPYMQRILNLTPVETEAMLYNESGLKGLSGISGDMRVLLASGDPRAALAVDYFIYRTAQQIAAMAVSLGGIDALVFTGGIGEHAGTVCDRIVDRLGFLSPFETHTIAANEEGAMALEVAGLLTVSGRQKVAE